MGKSLTNDPDQMEEKKRVDNNTFAHAPSVADCLPNYPIPQQDPHKILFMQHTAPECIYLVPIVISIADLKSDFTGAVYTQLHCLAVLQITIEDGRAERIST